MTKKNESTNESAVRSWYFPTLGVSVDAATYDEALELAQSQKKDQEDGDASS